ncbi:MAG: methionyl aminopeptidase [Phycisphaerales bacterium]|nr:methionyl aminopeptidase [Phycisphaerales bacterium]
MPKSTTPPIATPADVDAAFAAGQAVVEAHRRIVPRLRIGQTLAEIDAIVAEVLAGLGCRSCFLGYVASGSSPFPSHACLSVNECVVHGTHDYYTEPMRRGDVLKLDIGVHHERHDDWVGDAAWTYAFGEYPSEEAKRLMTCGRESLALGITKLQPGKPYVDWAAAVQGVVEGSGRGNPGYGFHLVRGLGGHGYFRDKLHGLPYIANVLPSRGDRWDEALVTWKPGNIVAVEPMIAVGTGSVKQTRAWPVFTADGSLSVHYEHDVLITEKGPRVLTEGMESLPNVVGT